MTTRPSNYILDQWYTTQTVPLGVATPGAPTMAAPAAPTMAARTATSDTAAQTVARPAYMPELAWSTEQPEPVASPTESGRALPRFVRPRVLAAAGGGLAAAAVAGLFLTLHGGASTASFDTSNHSTPVAASSPAPANPPSTPGTQTPSANVTHSAAAIRGSTSSTRPHHQAPAEYPPPSSGQYSGDQHWQSDHDTVTTPPTRNWNDYRPTYTRDYDSHSTREHDGDSRSTSDHDGDSQSTREHDGDSRSTSDHDDDGHSTGDHSNDNHPTRSNDHEDSK